MTSMAGEIDMVAQAQPNQAMKPATPLEAVSAVDLADILLTALIDRGGAALQVEVRGSEHVVTLELAGRSDELRVPSALGDAVAARLAIIAGLDVAASGDQLGRFNVRAGDREVELLVSLRPAPTGLSIEVRRLAEPQQPTADPTWEIEADGAIRIGSYRLRGELGRGGTGVVYAGEHTALDRAVAIKILYADLARDPVVAARFVREARTASRVHHPNIVDVTDFGTLPDGRAYLVMERVDGPTLDDELRRGAIDPERALMLARQMAVALHAAHEAGVIHRDLKPANVFLVRDDTVKLCDFGAAKLESSSAPSETQRGQVFGTPHYMSPEHARGLPTDRRTDIYALGCVLFEMLTGAVPYDGATPFDVLTQHIHNPIPPIESPRGPLPDAVEKLVMRAMAKRIEERYQTAAELAADLDRAATALARPGWRKWLPS